MFIYNESDKSWGKAGADVEALGTADGDVLTIIDAEGHPATEAGPEKEDAAAEVGHCCALCLYLMHARVVAPPTN